MTTKLILTITACICGAPAGHAALIRLQNTQPITQGPNMQGIQAQQQREDLDRQIRFQKAYAKRNEWQAQCFREYPYRKLGDVYLCVSNYCPQVLAYDWKDRPPYLQSWKFFKNFSIREMTDDYLLVSLANTNVIVVNHPLQKKAHPGMILPVFAARAAGTYGMTDFKKFDHGMVFDPMERKKQFEAQAKKRE